MGSVFANVCIAVVDDDESLRRSLARLLRASGYYPVTYASAEAFLADLARPAFGCLILDYQLDGMSGIELAEQLATSGSKVPVVFLTAHDISEELKLRPCAASVLRKSDPGNRVLAAIDQALLGQA